MSIKMEKEVIEKNCCHCGDKNNLSLYDNGPIKGNTREMVFICWLCKELTYMFYHETPEQTKNGEYGIWVFKGNGEEREEAINALNESSGDQMKRFLVVPVGLPHGEKIARVVAAPNVESAERFFRRRTGYKGMLMTGEKNGK